MLALLIATAMLAVPASAAEFARPAGPILLSLTGKIGAMNSDKAALFDEGMLSSLPRHQIVTSSPWTEGIKRFEGFRLKDLLDKVSPAGSILRAEGINGYRIDIPISDAEEFGVLIASRMDGKPLLRRDKGPLWIVYPRDAVAALQIDRYDSRWVWQLDKIEIR
ncbi:hypothetical protein ASE63_23145 [Bosea sp. Root381]|uniref:molybdopterin-dependent oxidoreductase n=1 Tax=Bosea sp. Root381 TaxID=1736524 RepID=UPI0006F94FB7|nr:molybdopterin-dependent oxidoreductase [Bosea sp. Root381]KRE07145.1 hypothetical protein ASE63_23145 [Bosea sp. Root381]